MSIQATSRVELLQGTLDLLILRTLLPGKAHGHAIAKPDSMWFGLWDQEQNVRGLPYLLQSWWRGPRRIKQYEGPHRRSLGGYTLDIDSDWVYGAVYR